MAVQPVVKLNPEARRMARSMRKLFTSIGRRDAKAIARNKPATIIFPPGDAVLTAHVAAVVAQLDAVLSIGIL